MRKPCPECAPYDGAWMETPEGLDRCGCSRGQELRAHDQAKAAPSRDVKPVVSKEAAATATEALGAMPFFPGDEVPRTMIGAEIRSMCRTNGDVWWLVRRMIRLYGRWPGAAEMRRVYCASRRPLDGMAEIGASDVYPDGIPAEHAQPERPRLDAPLSPESRRLLPARRSGPDEKRDSGETAIHA